ncbi:hypothetical protein SAMN05444487_1245 [Marininema mesophilum]|uniref:Uncharacterized protein n=1 Tax=Marininema mesophilum TaxID=1048340 RepID=A0A1H3CLX0_9BACL|nr:hypothetical protein SAMN05444487_1245 [Marininema mesophilum]
MLTRLSLILGAVALIFFIVGSIWFYMHAM